MIERDDDIPALAELVGELDRARQIAETAGAVAAAAPPLREAAGG
jgi:uncharacterized protein (UPF0276 family)